MTITDVYQQITLNANTTTFLQNQSEMRIILRVSTLIPTDDLNPIKIYPATRSGDGSFTYTNALGNLWVRVKDEDYDATETYELTVI